MRARGEEERERSLQNPCVTLSFYFFFFSCFFPLCYSNLSPFLSFLLDFHILILPCLFIYFGKPEWVRESGLGRDGNGEVCGGVVRWASPIRDTLYSGIYFICSCSVLFACLRLVNMGEFGQSYRTYISGDML